ncbi:MAG: BlaI/MecI/CopY family transcriptional regulator [Microgenomates group bacterium]|nr:BlaI/MecI/CopY family transcriptional regulator [Microgenomates group bacterium]
MNKKKLLKLDNKLGALEEKVLNLISDNVSPRMVVNLLKEINHHYAYTTIMTVMDKLFKKGYLKRNKIGKTFFYRRKKTIDREIYENNLALLDKLISSIGKINFLKISFYLFITAPFISFFSKPLLAVFLNLIIILVTFISGLNIFFNLYLNGFWEYLNTVIIQPDLFLKDASINTYYILETISLINLMLFFTSSLLIFYFLKKRLNRYKFNP